jgi:hypothetical protein
MMANNENETIYRIAWWDKNFYGFPFQRILDEKNNDIKIAVISAPLYKEDMCKYYEIKNKGYKFIGISSYGNFPIYNEEDSKHDSRSVCIHSNEMKEVFSNVRGWLYCNRNPDLIPFKIPKLFFSESDNPQCFNNISIKNLNKKYDVIYSAGSDSTFHKYHKNWKLAKECFKKMIENNLKVLVIGREKMDDPSEEHPNLILKKFTPYYEFLDLIEESRISFFPNVSDSSPRVLVESLLKGVPIVVNSQIFGGWKYVHSDTGVFFNDANDVMQQINHVLNNKYNTREWFIKNYYDNNKSKANIELTKFIKKYIENNENEKNENEKRIIIKISKKTKRRIFRWIKKSLRRHRRTKSATHYP